jgi:hypothetical protein
MRPCTFVASVLGEGGLLSQEVFDKVNFLALENYDWNVMFQHP